MRVIYVSGSYRNETIGGLFQNIIHARDSAIKLWQGNWVVICPHLNTFLMDGLCGDRVWLEGDLELLSRCDAIYMLNNYQDSQGALEELELAKKLGLEILFERE